MESDNIDVTIERMTAQIMAKVKKAVWESGQGVKTQAQKNLRSNGSVDTGALWGSVTSEMSEDGLTATVGTSMNLGAWVEFGSGPHGVSKEGQKAIEEWVNRKLGIAGPEGHSVAQAIVWKIRHEGQKPKPWLYPALESEKSNIKERIQLAVQDGLK